MGKKIGLLEDDAACEEIMRYILEYEGYEVTCLNADQLDLGIPLYLDLLIVDEYVRRKTGCIICKEIKSNVETGRIPVILSSTSSFDETKASISKADAFLPKPYEIADLIYLVNNFTARDILLAN